MKPKDYDWIETDMTKENMKHLQEVSVTIQKCLIQKIEQKVPIHLLIMVLNKELYNLNRTGEEEIQNEKERY